MQFTNVTTLRNRERATFEKPTYGEKKEEVKPNKGSTPWKRPKQTYDEKKEEEEEPSLDRFHRQACDDASLEEPCVLIIEGRTLDVRPWAKAHPGGSQILRQYHGKDASQAFDEIGHSRKARAMLGRFVVSNSTSEENTSTGSVSYEKRQSGRKAGGKRAVGKLFTHEDRYNVHKSLGVFCLCNFAYRFALMLFGDPTAGLTKWPGLLALLPHAMLSASSLIFASVPRERVVGQPMMWREFRAHSIIFGIRSVLCSMAAAASISLDHAQPYRTLTVVFSALVVLGALVAASCATDRLEPAPNESTTATMPYWKGCPKAVQRMFKHFYALAQFLATTACFMVQNPAWPLAILFPIQGAAFLLTLVRKGILTPRGYHAIYTLQLLSVYAVAIRHLFWMRTPDLLVLFAVSAFAYQLRRMGVDKFFIWVPIVLLRVFLGDHYMAYSIW